LSQSERSSPFFLGIDIILASFHVLGNSPFQSLENIFCKQFKPEAELFAEFSSSGRIKALQKIQ
jgi:hypothetical protein